MHTKKSVTELGYKIIGCAIEVHKEIGPGLLEAIHEDCLFAELQSNGFEVKKQVKLPVFYKGKRLNKTYRVDLIVDNIIILELKVLEYILPVHRAQLLSYMKLAQIPKGILINFHTDNITKTGIHLVNELFKKLPEE